MKLIEKFANFKPVIESYLTGDNYSVQLSTKDKVSYMRILPFNKKGFTYYELDTINNQCIQFSVVTVQGFKTIRKDSSKCISTDLSVQEWVKVLAELTDNHMDSEEYQSFLKGYTKAKSGCSAVFISFLIIISIFLTIN
ncbi:hypothetical protein [Polaribacter septentrionalilitoris]|uniref:hypothetical protein n=1 Tax=Polaribacter septentrionalilitoris TaxID=2494657 RepID=UPI00135C3E9E|nr:hypothetical protein [Polaribacter septentrionalilitoris]